MTREGPLDLHMKQLFVECDRAPFAGRDLRSVCLLSRLLLATLLTCKEAHGKAGRRKRPTPRLLWGRYHAQPSTPHLISPLKKNIEVFYVLPLDV